VDERAGRRVDLLAVEGERRASAQHDVDLLVAVRALGVLLDHPLAGLLRRVCVRAERADVEPAPERSPRQALVVGGERLEVVEVRDLVGGPAAHAEGNSGSSRIGSRSESV
jgi:hypothetical protein